MIPDFLMTSGTKMYELLPNLPIPVSNPMPIPIKLD